CAKRNYYSYFDYW
nr:immunoglobulin heavy chain junction region [Mus musculus]